MGFCVKRIPSCSTIYFEQKERQTENEKKERQTENEKKERLTENECVVNLARN